MTTKLAKRLSSELEMCTKLWPITTGLPMHVWISENEYHKGPRYRPRIRVVEENLDIIAAAGIDDPVEILEGLIPDGAWQLLTQYIRMNQKMLLLFWAGSIDSSDYVNLHQMVGPTIRAQASRNKILKKFRKEIIAEKSHSYMFGVTGLPFTIWITDRDHARGCRNRPRLKVTNLGSGTAASVSFDNQIEVLEGELPFDWFKLIVRYIKLNRKLLLQRWNVEADLMDFIHGERAIMHKPQKFVQAGNHLDCRPYELPYSY